MKALNMPGEQPKAERQVSGDDIIAEILRNAGEAQFRMRKTVVLPSVFHVYLNQADYDLIRPVLGALRSEARNALREKTEEWNRQAQPSKFAKLLGFENSEAPREHKILDPDYTIEFYPDVEQALGRGDIEVRSELASAPPPDFDGAMTRQVTRRDGAVSYSEPVGSSHSTHDPDATVAVSRPDPTSGVKVYGWLRYSDEGTPQEYAVTKDEIAVGRGGKTVWVDLRVNAPPDVSREHCRIRRDTSGRFYITDLSQFGTSVDGRRLPSAQGGGTEVELPPKATINLADVVTLEWEKG